jgi:hypothetical protein
MINPDPVHVLGLDELAERELNEAERPGLGARQLAGLEALERLTRITQILASQRPAYRHHEYRATRSWRSVTSRSRHGLSCEAYVRCSTTLRASATITATSSGCPSRITGGWRQSRLKPHEVRVREPPRTGSEPVGDRLRATGSDGSAEGRSTTNKPKGEFIMTATRDEREEMTEEQANEEGVFDCPTCGRFRDASELTAEEADEWAASLGVKIVRT